MALFEPTFGGRCAQDLRNNIINQGLLSQLLRVTHVVVLDDSPHAQRRLSHIVASALTHRSLRTLARAGSGRSAIPSRQVAFIVVIVHVEEGAGSARVHLVDSLGVDQLGSASVVARNFSDNLATDGHGHDARESWRHVTALVGDLGRELSASSGSRLFTDGLRAKGCSREDAALGLIEARRVQAEVHLGLPNGSLSLLKGRSFTATARRVHGAVVVSTDAHESRLRLTSLRQFRCSHNCRFN